MSLWKHLGLDVKAAMRVEDLRSTVSSQNRAWSDGPDLPEKYK